MTSIVILLLLYIIDILDNTIINVIWGIGDCALTLTIDKIITSLVLQAISSPSHALPDILLPSFLQFPEIPDHPECC